MTPALLPLAARVKVGEEEGFILARSIGQPISYDVRLVSGKVLRRLESKDVELIDRNPATWDALPAGVRIYLLERQTTTT